MKEIDLRINALRKEMINRGLDAYIIPSSDAHQSEYVHDHWKSREWISGFTGSAGIVVITKDHAGLWTDSRYFLQAEEELSDCQMVLHKQGIPHAPEHTGWLKDQLKEGSKVGLDGSLFSLNQIQHLNSQLTTKQIVIETNHDLIAQVRKDRPALPDNPIFEHSIKYAGKSRSEKLTQIRREMHTQGVEYHLITTLDDIAWIFNIRGDDIEFNPLAIAYAVIGPDKTWLFIDEIKVSPELTACLLKDTILLKPYGHIRAFLMELPKEQKILINPATISVFLADLLTSGQIKKGPTLSTKLKAIKNSTEIACLRQTMVKDGVALVKLYRWLETQVQSGSVKETEVAEQLAAFRKLQSRYRGESFSAIVGYKGNGAIVHYRPLPQSCAAIKNEGILLLDSGGQYEDGTTDITRTTAFGTPTSEQKQNFTLVLKGHIAIADLIFPKGTKGIQIDAMARQPLWKYHLNYGHGTGHGVGFFLNVHEGPQGFSISVARAGAAFEPGMITSNEPGFYKQGEYGIRIENLLLCVEDKKSDYGDFLKFESLSLFPIDQQLIEKELLTHTEINWLNNYHQEVLNKLSPHLNQEEQNWLKTQCQIIQT